MIIYALLSWVIHTNNLYEQDLRIKGYYQNIETCQAAIEVLKIESNNTLDARCVETKSDPD